jgi:hypothetical protein
MKKDSNIAFYIVCIICASLIVFLLGNQWFFKIAGITLDKYSMLLVFALIGLSLLPFMNKIKIGSLLELERLKKEIKEVKTKQYLGEVIKSPKDDLFFYDSDGKHIMPDEETATFLRSSKGEISVTQEDIDSIPTSYPIDSVLTSRIVDWNGDIFVILNGRKFHVASASFFADWNRQRPFSQIGNEEIRLIPTGK